MDAGLELGGDEVVVEPTDDEVPPVTGGSDDVDELEGLVIPIEVEEVPVDVDVVGVVDVDVADPVAVDVT